MPDELRRELECTLKEMLRFSQVIGAFHAHDADIQKIVIRMGEIMNSQAADEQERAMAAVTWMEAMFPAKNRLGCLIGATPEPADGP